MAAAKSTIRALKWRLFVIHFDTFSRSILPTQISSLSTNPSLGNRRDLTNGVIVVLSGGAFDLTNPIEVRDRMDTLIQSINDDPYVQANTGNKGLAVKLLPNWNLHIHQSEWPAICDQLKFRVASPLILVGHSNGGAAVLDLARCVQAQGKAVDLAITADSVLTLNDNGDCNKVPSNVRINLNPYVIPTPFWPILPFPFGQPNHRESDSSLDGILNIGLPFPEPGAIAHRDAFYDLAGGDSIGNNFTYPEMMLDTALAVLRGATADEVFQLAENHLQILANESRVAIDLETKNFKTTLIPAGASQNIIARRLTQSKVQALHQSMTSLEPHRLSAFQAM